MTILPEKITIGSRQSPLAKKQVEIFVEKFKEIYGPKMCSILDFKYLKTSGDKLLDKNISKFGNKGLFTKELDQAQLKNEIDVSIHSLKDLPTKINKKLCLALVLQREDPRDAIYSVVKKKISDLKPKNIIGTSSIRRAVQIKRILPNVILKQIRGNIDTRINKTIKGEYDAIILAVAGLKRLKIKKFTALDVNEFVPAACQGIIGVVIKKNKENLIEILSKLNCRKTFLEAKCERLFLDTLDGSCETPIGGYAKIQTINNKKKLSFFYMASSKSDDAFVKGKVLFSIENFEDEIIEFATKIKKKING